MKWLLTLLVSLTFCHATVAQSLRAWVLGDGGIHLLSLDSKTGALTQPQLIAELSPASWLVIHPTSRVLYASYSGNGDAGVASFTYDIGGQLTPQSRIKIPSGWPTHISVDPLGRSLATAHWGGGTVCLVALNPDGSFRSDQEVTTLALPFEKPGPSPIQVQSRPHWSRFTADGALLHVTDLGGDAVWTLNVGHDPLTLAVRDRLQMPVGSGPRHMAISSVIPFAYVNGEIGNTISVLSYDQTTYRFNLIETRPVLGPQDIEPSNTTSEIRVHRSGKFVYVGNRGHDSISVFSINQRTGKLTPVERESIRGSWPRNFNMGPNGRWLLAAGQRSNTVASFEINQETGALTFTRNLVNVPGPVRVLFVDAK